MNSQTWYNDNCHPDEKQQTINPDMSTVKKQQKRSDDSIFDEIEAELPEDLTGLMYDGKRLNGHATARGYLDDDGRS